MTGGTNEPDDYPYDLHDLVQILGSKCRGRVAAVTFSKYHEALYVVEYIDATGCPQQGEWFHEQLELIEPADAARAQAEDEEDLPDNVVPLRRVVN